ncbi:MAG TPA: bifunctional riboflavin kinase/FAD synthetase [Vicinamibacterales bacterium]|nr:bifunctional riboflavin kinase/FAD synthetase [Vicinamibacterales bacterium]
MQIVRFPGDGQPLRWREPVVALGNFDGLHRGHMKIIDRVRRRAAERAGTAVAMTFDPHPPRVVRPDKAPALIMTLEQKLEAFDRAGMQGVAIVAFTPDMSRWPPDRFVETVLVEWLRASEVWVGANFLFGHDRAGNFSLLRMLGEQHGFRAEKIDPVRYKDFVVSSTRVRRLISEGRVDEAAALLGHHHFVDGVIVAGEGRGRQIGVPTANLRTANELLPGNGVYATYALLSPSGRSGAERVAYPAVTNIGVRPTFGGDSTAVHVETHLLDMPQTARQPDLYGQTMRLLFVQRVRDERTFDGPGALTAQIRADIDAARALFGQVSL